MRLKSGVLPANQVGEKGLLWGMQLIHPIKKKKKLQERGEGRHGEVGGGRNCERERAKCERNVQKDKVRWPSGQVNILNKRHASKDFSSLKIHLKLNMTSKPTYDEETFCVCLWFYSSAAVFVIIV